MTPEANGRWTPVLLTLGPLVAVNCAVWVCAWLAFAGQPGLLGVALLAWTLGLRHAVDADHIAAIDNVVRLMSGRGQQSRLVGLFFALGHSSVVVLACLAIAAGVTAFDPQLLKDAGGIIGGAVSAVFLLTIAAMNMAVLAGTWRVYRRGAASGETASGGTAAGHGLIARLCGRLFRSIRHDWQMYPLGFLFGLGFDTATEIGLLSIAASEASRGMSPWVILVFPALFSAGMTLVDTADSVLMTEAYGWGFAAPSRRLWYNLAMTGVSVVVALIIGGLGAFGVVMEAFGLEGGVWDYAGALGGGIANPGFVVSGLLVIGLFVIGWGGAALVYRLRQRDVPAGVGG